MIRMCSPASSQRTKLLALANLQNSIRKAGTGVRGFNSEKTRAKSSSGVSKKIAVSTSTTPEYIEGRG